MFRAIMVSIVCVLGTPSAAFEVPQEVIRCMQQAKRVFIDTPPSMQSIRQYVDAEAALVGIRNPVTDSLKEQVYVSAYNFARFVYAESQKRMGSEKAQMQIIRYRSSSVMRIIEGRVGDPSDVPSMTHFTIKLAGPSGCVATDFVVASFRGMLDGVPRL